MFHKIFAKAYSHPVVYLQLSGFSLFHNCIMERCNVTVIFNVEDVLRILYNMKSSHIYPTFESNVCEINVHSSISSGRKFSNLSLFETLFRKRCKTFNAINRDGKN